MPFHGLVVAQGLSIQLRGREFRGRELPTHRTAEVSAAATKKPLDHRQPRQLERTARLRPNLVPSRLQIFGVRMYDRLDLHHRRNRYKGSYEVTHVQRARARAYNEDAFEDRLVDF